MVSLCSVLSTGDCALLSAPLRYWSQSRATLQRYMRIRPAENATESPIEGALMRRWLSDFSVPVGEAAVRTSDFRYVPDAVAGPW